MQNRVKYPRTPHVPWSPGATADDRRLVDFESFCGRTVVVTEKMDGENTTIYRDGVHARSVDSRGHPSRNWVKGLHGQMGHKIPQGWRVCGENLFARHSIAYDKLESYFLVFSIWDESNRCLDWAKAVELAVEWGLALVPVLDIGLFCERSLKSRVVDTKLSEGWVVRVADSFKFSEFEQNVAKWVRAQHVQTDEHWMGQKIVPNRIRTAAKNLGSHEFEK